MPEEERETYEIRLVYCKLRKTDSKYIFPGDIIEHDKIDRTITKEQFNKIKKILDGK